MELVEDLLFRFWQARSKCFSQITKAKMVKIVMASFNFAIQKKLVNQNIADMAQLVKKVK